MRFKVLCALLILPMGQCVTLEAGRPQGGAQVGGKVTAVIPKATVLHGGQDVPSSPLKVQDKVYWQDVVRTLNMGHVQITLLDGSTLNLGVRSEMKIIQHDPLSQQTAIELPVGKLHIKVRKISYPGGKFEVTIQTAFIGVVGTDFIVESHNDRDKRKRKTLVWCLEGPVMVRNIDAAIFGPVVLNAGEFTTIPFRMPPAATRVSPSEMKKEIRLTNPFLTGSIIEPQMLTHNPGPDGVYRVGGDVSAPIPIFKPEPEYTEEARNAKYQGTAVLWIVVDATGAVTDCKVLKPLGKGLDERAVETVKTWKFKPAMRNGTPVPVRVMVEVAFRL
jgi:TonB family protein